MCGTGLDATNETEWSASGGNAVALLRRPNLRAFRSIVNSYSCLCTGGVAKTVLRRQGAVASLQLSLGRPYHIDRDKQERGKTRLEGRPSQ